MNKYNVLLTAVCLGNAALLGGCTTASSTAGATSTFYDGTINGMELIDLQDNKNDGKANSIIGMIVGGIVGNLVHNHSSGTAVGALVGGLVGSAASHAANHIDGVRLTLDTNAGSLVVDMPFSCRYDVGKKIRLLSSQNDASVMIYENGGYETVSGDSYSKCSALYESIKNGEKRPSDPFYYDPDSTDPVNTDPNTSGAQDTDQYATDPSGYDPMLDDPALYNN